MTRAPYIAKAIEALAVAEYEIIGFISALHDRERKRGIPSSDYAPLKQVSEALALLRTLPEEKKPDSAKAAQELKPCPFCSGKPRDKLLPITYAARRPNSRKTKLSRICSKCGAHGPIKVLPSEADIAWDTRTLPDAGENERELPVLPKGWFLDALIWHGNNWVCTLVINGRHFSSLGPTPRAAVLAALAEITPPKAGEKS